VAARSTRVSKARPPPSVWRQRLARWSRPPRRLRVTREGKVFIGVTVGVGLAAVNTGNNLLYLVLGLMLSLIIVSGLLSEMVLRGLRFKRKLPRRAFASAPMLVEIEVHNVKRRAPSYSIEVEDRIENRPTDKRCYFLKVSAGARQTAAYRRTPPSRGTERFLALRVATRFPFGLFEKWREIELVEDKTVYPMPARTPRNELSTTQTGDHVPRQGQGRGEVDGVRELRPEEPARDIDWKKTASRGRMIARERRREGTRHLALELANRPPPSVSTPANDGPAAVGAAGDDGPAAFRQRCERDFRRAAWLALDALRDGATVELRAHDGGDGAPRTLATSPSATAADRVLGFLARLPPEPVAATGGPR